MSQITDLLNQATIKDLTDGTKQNEPLQKVTDNRCGAYARVTRPEQTIKSYACAGVENNYYPGNILLVDDKFLTKDPTVIPFREDERKPLNYSLSTGAYLPISEDPFKNVVPTERNVNQARNRFAYLYGKDCAANSRKLGNNLEIEERFYSSGASLNVGGTIKGVDLSIGGSFNNYRTKVFVLKQKLYTVSLDNTYKNGDDFFTENVNIGELEKAMSHSVLRKVLNEIQSNPSRPGRPGHFGSPKRPTRPTTTKQQVTEILPLGIIQDVSYGRMAIITVSSKDQSSANVEITKYCKLDFKGGSSSCNVNIKIVGGSIAGYAGGAEVSGEDAANKIISYLYTHQVEAADVETAKPIEYTVSHLKDMKKMVTTKILPYAQVYVEKVCVRVYEDNGGASYVVDFKCLDVKPNAQGKPDYTTIGAHRDLDFDGDMNCFVSPRALCLQFRVETKGTTSVTEKYQKSVFCPRIPLEKMEPEDSGNWIFRLGIHGSTYFSNKYQFSPTLDEADDCHWCSYDRDLSSHDGVMSNSAYYIGKTESEILQRYRSWGHWN